MFADRQFAVRNLAYRVEHIRDLDIRRFRIGFDEFPQPGQGHGN